MEIYFLKGIILSYLAVKVICDHMSGRSKGYGFLRFISETAAATALKEMDGQVNVLFNHEFFFFFNCLKLNPVKCLILK
jgi:RNA recognition motif-containing protein